jgi:hypothetical protein
MKKNISSLLCSLVCLLVMAACSHTGPLPVKMGQDTRVHLCAQSANSIFQTLEVLQSIQVKKKKSKTKVDTVAGTLLFPESKPKNICKLEFSVSEIGAKITYGLFVQSKGTSSILTNFAGTAIGDNTDQIIDRCETAGGVEKIWYKPNFYLERDMKSGAVRIEGSREGYLDNFVCVFE